MAKKKAGGKPSDKDRHKAGARMIRLPPEHAAMLDKIAAAEDRTRTMIVVRALRAYYQQGGYQFPPADAE